MSSIELTEIASTGNVKLLQDDGGFAYIKNGEAVAIQITRGKNLGKLVEL